MKKLAFPFLALTVMWATAAGAEQKIGYIDSETLARKKCRSSRTCRGSSTA